MWETYVFSLGRWPRMKTCRKTNTRSLCPSVCLSACLSVCLSLSLCFSLYLCLCLSPLSPPFLSFAFSLSSLPLSFSHSLILSLLRSPSLSSLLRSFSPSLSLLPLLSLLPPLSLSPLSPSPSLLIFHHSLTPPLSHPVSSLSPSPLSPTLYPLSLPPPSLLIFLYPPFANCCRLFSEGQWIESRTEWYVLQGAGVWSVDWVSWEVLPPGSRYVPPSPPPPPLPPLPFHRDNRPESLSDIISLICQLIFN